MPEYFLWFFLIVVTSANSHFTNIPYKFTTTGDLCCPGIQQQEEIALDEKGRIALLGLISNTQHFEARNDSNGTDDTEVDVKSLVSVLQLDQTEVGYSGTKRYSPHAHGLTAAFLAFLVPIPLISWIEEYYIVSLYVLLAFCLVPLCCSALLFLGTPLHIAQSVHFESSDDDALTGPLSNSANILVALIVVLAVSFVSYFSHPFIPPYMKEDSDAYSSLFSEVGALLELDFETFFSVRCEPEFQM